jgi:peroxiredoxin
MGPNPTHRKRKYARYRSSTPLLLLTFAILMLGLGAPVFSADNRPQAPVLEGKDLQGNKVRLSDLKGNVVVVSFWATWCVPCKKEMKILNKHLHAKKDEGLRVIAISMDGPETAADVRATVKRYRWTMPVIHDKDGSITSVHNPRSAAPYTIFVDRAGRIAHAHEGFSQGDKEKLVARIDRLLAESAP